MIKKKIKLKKRKTNVVRISDESYDLVIDAIIELKKKNGYRIDIAEFVEVAIRDKCLQIKDGKN